MIAPDHPAYASERAFGAASERVATSRSCSYLLAVERRAAVVPDLVVGVGEVSLNDGANLIEQAEVAMPAGRISRTMQFTRIG